MRLPRKSMCVPAVATASVSLDTGWRCDEPGSLWCGSRHSRNWRGRMGAAGVFASHFIAMRGAPFFTLSAWQQLQGLQDGVPEASELPPLNGREVVRVIQWSAPHRVLDAYPAAPRLQRESIVAVTDGDIDGEVHAVDQALTRYFESARPVTITSRASMSSRIEFWLDLPGVPRWNAFARSEAGIVLLFDDEYACVLAG